MKIPYTPDAEKFYCGLPSYKRINRKSFFGYIYVSKYDICSPLPSTEIEKRFYTYGKRAQDKKITFNIDIGLFQNLIKGKCTYCGDDAYSVDRIDSSKGYEYGNVQTACKMCNMMKYVYSENEFLEHIKKIFKRNNGIKLIEL